MAGQYRDLFRLTNKTGLGLREVIGRLVLFHGRRGEGILGSPSGEVVVLALAHDAGAQAQPLRTSPFGNGHRLAVIRAWGADRRRCC